MRNEPMEANGVRLPPALWRTIEHQAEVAGISRSEWLRRAISAFLLLGAALPNTSEKTRNGHDKRPVETILLDEGA